MLKEIGLGFLIVFVLIGLEFYFEHLELGGRAELLTFEFLQGRLPPFRARERLPVLVVDISEIPGGRGQLTSRTKLKELLGAIARYRPKAIAIDIDLSPDENGFRSPDDPDFFEYCLELSERVPIFLGVYSAREDLPEVWLGVRNYRKLAVDMFIYREPLTNATTKIPRWTTPLGSSEGLRAMSFALASEYVKGKWPGPPWFLKGAVEIPPVNLPSASVIGSDHTDAPRSVDTLINYSKLEQIEHEMIATISPTSVDEFKSFYRDKMVILGDATEAYDWFIPPGRGVTPGVYLHASAAYTLAIEPVFELKLATRLFLDVFFSLPILGVALWRHRDKKDNGTEEGRSAKKWGAIWVAALSVIVLGSILVRMQVMWVDFFVVVFALFLHPFGERVFDYVKTKAKAVTTRTPW